MKICINCRMHKRNFGYFCSYTCEQEFCKEHTRSFITWSKQHQPENVNYIKKYQITLRKSTETEEKT